MVDLSWHDGPGMMDLATAMMDLATAMMDLYPDYGPVPGLRPCTRTMALYYQCYGLIRVGYPGWCTRGTLGA